MTSTKKRKLSHKFTRLIKKNRLASVAILVAVTGSAFLLVSYAAVSSSTIEAESGTRTGSVVPVTDPTASAGSAILFGSKTTGISTPIQRAMVNAPHYGTSLYFKDADVSFLSSYNTHVTRVGNGKKPDMLRTFGSSMTGAWTWSSISHPNVSGHNKGVWHSFKVDFAKAASGSQNAAWTASVKTIPVDGRPKMITIHHEPENDVPSTNPDAWILNWVKSQVEIGKAVKAANHPDVTYGPVLMSRWYIDGLPKTDKGSLYRFMDVAQKNGLLDDLNQVYDFIGWDPYHDGSMDEPQRLAAPRNNAKHYYDVPYAFTKEFFPDKKFAIGETGVTANTSESYRVDWFKTIKAWVDSKPGQVLAVCYYDAGMKYNWYLSLGTGGTVSEPYQQAAARYWGSLYK